MMVDRTYRAPFAVWCWCAAMDLLALAGLSGSRIWMDCARRGMNATYRGDHD